MVKIKFGKKLWSQFFKISIFWSQSRDHLKIVNCSTSSLTFDKFYFLTNKRPYKRNSFISIIQIKFGRKWWSHFFQILTLWYQSRSYFKYVACSTFPVNYLLNSTFRLIISPPKRTPLCRWFKSVMKALLQIIKLLI